MSWMRESTIKAIAFPLYAVTLVMLIGVEALGFVSKGAQRWLDLGPIRLQPSEFMKPAIVLTLARFYELVPAGRDPEWRAIWPALLLLGVPAFLILVQPDLGTCIMVMLCGVTVMFLAGLPWWLFAGPAAAIAVAAPIVYSMMHGYQRKRIDVFLDPESDPARRRLSYRSVEDRDRIGRASGARASSTAARAISITCPRATPTSSSRPWPRNGDWSAGCS